MIQILVYLACLFVIFNIIKNNSYKRVVWFIVGLLMIPPGVTLGGKPLSWFIILSLIIGLLVNTNDFRKLKYIPLKKTIIFFCCCLCIVGLFDNRISIPQKIIRPILYFYENVLPCILVYIALISTKDYKKLYIALVYLATFFGLYGILCYLNKSNLYITQLSTEFKFRNLALDYLNGSDGRVRISSFLFHPFLYGIILVFVISYAIFLYQNHSQKINKKVLAAILILLITNLLLTNSRTILIVFMLQVGLYVLLQTNSKNIFIVIGGVVFTYIMIMFIPALSEKIDLLLDLVQSGGTKVQGSSVEMREVQLLASYKYFLQKPISGNGFNYIYEGIGFRTEISERNSSAELYAFESYFYILLIEQGVSGILGNLILFISLTYYCIKNFFKVFLLNHKRYIICSMLIIIGYLVFILATGTINSLPFFFIFVGISLSVQQKLISNNIPIEIKSSLI